MLARPDLVVGGLDADAHRFQGVDHILTYEAAFVAGQVEVAAHIVRGRGDAAVVLDRHRAVGAGYWIVPGGQHLHAVFRYEIPMRVYDEASGPRIPHSVWRLHRKESLPIDRCVQLVSCHDQISGRKVDMTPHVEPAFVLEHLAEVSFEACRLSVRKIVGDHVDDFHAGFKC